MNRSLLEHSPIDVGCVHELAVKECETSEV